MGSYAGASIGNISNHFYLDCSLHSLFFRSPSRSIRRNRSFSTGRRTFWRIFRVRLHIPRKKRHVRLPLPPEFVFARFAWSILLFAIRFVISGTQVPKLLTTYDPVTETSRTKTWRAAEADMKFGGGGSQKSTSRKGKKRARDEVDDDGVSYTDSEDARMLAIPRMR
jgi:hypothetical protein